MIKRIWNLPKVDIQSFSSIEERRPSLLITSLPAWNAVKSRLHLPIIQQLEATEATTHHWDKLIASIESQDAQVVYAVGGGLTADAAKYIAVKLGLPMVCLPTALSVDAFLTAASGIRKEGCVYYIETKPPEHLILDLDVISAAPEQIRAAGITDVMSIATGCWDWKFAHQQGQNPPGMEFIPWVYENARSILNGVLDCAEAAGRGDVQGLKTLFDCLCMEVQLCNQVGHARPEEGSEHYFAYLVENFTGHGFPHGDLVGPGILLMAEKQHQNVQPLRQALEACNIPLDNLSSEYIQRAIKDLPAYCRKHQLPFGIAHDLESGH